MRDLISPLPIEANLKKAPTLCLPCSVKGTDEVKKWGVFDLLSVRAIDDLPLDDTTHSTLLLLSHGDVGEGWKVVPFPSQIALERFFFHLGSPKKLLIDPSLECLDVVSVQKGFKTGARPSSRHLEAERAVIPLLIGASELGFPRKCPAESALTELYNSNQHFSVYYAARRLRIEKDSRVGWFYELLSLSFLGLPDTALELYEAYPHRGGAVADVQFINARYRSLLNQHNEARTLLHALSFNPEFAQYAKRELARSFISTQEYERARELAQGVVDETPTDSDALLLLGISLRGLGLADGEEKTLKNALSALEKVTQIGGFNSPEALFHSGVIFSRLGALSEAELVFRQSLFQRDRYATRDSLIRVLATLGDRESALAELDALVKLRPSQAQELRVELAELLASSASMAHGEARKGRDAEEHAARDLLARWEIPSTGTLLDLSFFDHFINYFAPSGQFCGSLKFKFLRGREREDVARALSLCIGGALCRAGVARWVEEDSKDEVEITLTSNDIRVPLQRFVVDRISLGAGGDEQSDLQSLIEEAHDYSVNATLRDAIPVRQEMSRERIEHLSLESAWLRDALSEQGVELTMDLNSLPILDRVFDASFEPGGDVKEGQLDKVDVPRLIDAAGIHVARVIDALLPAVWIDHPELEGLRIDIPEVGSLWPVARTHTRAFFGPAVDEGGRLTSLGLGIATAYLSAKVGCNQITEPSEGIKELTRIYSAFAMFDEEEIAGLVDVIFRNSKNAHP